MRIQFSIVFNYELNIPTHLKLDISHTYLYFSLLNMYGNLLHKYKQNAQIL